VVEVQVCEERRGVQGRPDCSRLLQQHITQCAQASAQVEDERLVPLDLEQEA
jgi:hypothetical protein